MTYASALEEAPPELRLPLLRIAEALEAKMRDQLAVRREDFDALRSTVHELAEAQARTEGRVGRLEVAVTELAEAQKRTEQRVEELAEAQKRTEQRMDEFHRTQLSMADQMDRFGREQDKQKGDRLERQYREKPFAYFSRILRRARVVPLHEIEDDLVQRLNEEELDDLRPLDLLVRGRLHNQEQTRGDVWLALEISAMVDRNDVERAQRQGAILRRAGYLAVSGVAGEGITQGGVEAAEEEKVVLFRNGMVQFWEAALAQMLAGL